MSRVNTITGPKKHITSPGILEVFWSVPVECRALTSLFFCCSFLTVIPYFLPRNQPHVFLKALPSCNYLFAQNSVLLWCTSQILGSSYKCWKIQVQEKLWYLNNTGCRWVRDLRTEFWPQSIALSSWKCGIHWPWIAPRCPFSGREGFVESARYKGSTPSRSQDWASLPELPGKLSKQFQ